MEKFILAQTAETPSVCLDPENGIYKIEGSSIPSDAGKFYVEISNWFIANSSQLNKPIKLATNFDYFNSATSKQILATIAKIADAIGKNNFCIEWHYEKEDEDMLATGNRFAQLSGVRFEFVSIG